MNGLGKTIRLRRVINPRSGSAIICALDHGMTSPILLSGLVDIEVRARQALEGGANAFMLSRGMARRVIPTVGPDTGFLLMLTASTAGRPGGPVIAPIGSVDEALSLGADAVVVYVALAGDDEREMLSYASRVGEACDRVGMPFIAEAEFPNAYQDLDEMVSTHGAEYLARNARLCAELGADIVKVNWSGDAASFASIVRGAGVPVVVAGGTILSDKKLLHRFEAAKAAGAIGCSVGRNIFQHRDPRGITRAIARVFNDSWSADEALAELDTPAVAAEI